MTRIEQALFALLRSALRGEPAREDPELSSDEWQALLRLSLSQQLLPLVYECAYRLPSFRALEPAVRQEFRLLYPIDGADHNGKTVYETSEPMILYRSLRVTEEPLPEGPIYIEYWARDMFMRPLTIGKVEMYWDGQTLTLAPGETWEGTTLLTAPE